MLTGGASSRMGTDKSNLEIDGETLALRILRSLSTRCDSVCVLGREPIPGFNFLQDRDAYAGPLAALARYEPSAEIVFVASCDLPGFDAEIIGAFKNWIGEFDCVLPVCDGRLQPLCGLYRSRAWHKLSEVASEGRKNLMAWVDRLEVKSVSQSELQSAGLDPLSVCGANTPEEWKRFNSNLDELRQGGGI